MTHTALIFDIKRDCSEDGPGIRTTVFFKGCPLRCLWCQNPEGIDNAVNLRYNLQQCRRHQCGLPCIESCPRHCLSLTQSGIHVNRQECTVCHQCSQACPEGALQTVGYEIDLEALMYRLLIDKPFYHSSGGGVTLSGGEASQQMSFCHHLLKALKAEGIATAIETCGFFNYRRFTELLLPWLDLVYFDLKLINATQSRHYTGQSNTLILQNFTKLIASQQVRVIPRVPLIPRITATPDNLTGLACFLAANGVDSASLLPYNPLWHDKAQSLGIKPRFHYTRFMSPEQKNQCHSVFQSRCAAL